MLREEFAHEIIAGEEAEEKVMQEKLKESADTATTNVTATTTVPLVRNSVKGGGNGKCDVNGAMVGVGDGRVHALITLRRERDAENQAAMLRQTGTHALTGCGIHFSLMTDFLCII